VADYKKYVCTICGHIYDEAQGDAEGGVAPGTRWEDVPPDWVCPDCGASKSDFVLYEDSND
jgi:rubredoxin